MYARDTVNMLREVGGLLSNEFPYIASNMSNGHPNTSGICDRTHRIKFGDGTMEQKTVTQQEMKNLLINYGPVVADVQVNTAF